MSGELWLAEGFTQYYGPLSMARAGLLQFDAFVGAIGGLVASVALDPAHLVRSAEEMSQMAVFTDRGRSGDQTNWAQTFISYYPFGGAIALALDLTLRGRSDGRTTLDDFMRAMWRVHGAPGGAREGFVDRPYSIADAEARLAETSGDAASPATSSGASFRAASWPIMPLCCSAPGFRPPDGSRAAWVGDVRFDEWSGTVRLASPPPFGTRSTPPDSTSTMRSGSWTVRGFNRSPN